MLFEGLGGSCFFQFFRFACVRDKGIDLWKGLFARGYFELMDSSRQSIDFFIRFAHHFDEAFKKLFQSIQLRMGPVQSA
jgi:hypothetical protein